MRVIKNYSVVFPGQGSEYAGMMKKYIYYDKTVKEIFKYASIYSGIDVEELCTQAKLSEYKSNVHTQIAVLTTSIALFYIFIKRYGIKPKYFAGHSLGEITALVCSQVITFKDAINLIMTKGKLIDELAIEGKMIAVIGISKDNVEKICHDVNKIANCFVNIANENSNEQITISGNSKGIDRLCALLEQNRIYYFDVNVRHPFHTKLMQKVSDSLVSSIKNFDIHFNCNVYSNVTGEPFRNKEEILNSMIYHITSKVQWSKIMINLNLKSDKIIEIGPQNLLRNMYITSDFNYKIFSIDLLNDCNSLSNDLLYEACEIIYMELVPDKLMLLKLMVKIMCISKVKKERYNFQESLTLYTMLNDRISYLSTNNMIPTKLEILDAIRYTKKNLKLKGYSKNEISSIMDYYLKKFGLNNSILNEVDYDDERR